MQSAGFRKTSSVSPALLGHPEIELDEAPSKTMRQKRFKHLQTACAHMVAGELRNDLESLVRSQLGQRQSGPWFRYEVDSRTDSPVLWFDYESAFPATGGYIIPAVKLEFGSLNALTICLASSITHPNIDVSIEITDEQLQTCLGAYRWFGEVSDGILGLPIGNEA